MAPIESSVLAQSEGNKHVGGAGPANQNQAFKNHHLPAGAEENNKMADVRVEELSRFKCLLRIIESYRIYVSTRQLTVFKDMTIILVEIDRMTLDALWSEKSTICQRNISPLVKMLTITPFNTVSWYLLWKY